jgi:SAM-dependent methyltransferase
MIKQGVLLAGKRGVRNVCFALAKVEKIPLPEGTADLVISLYLLDLIPDVLEVLKEVKRVLKKTGRAGYFFVFPLGPGDRLPEKAAVWQTRLIESGLRPPQCFSLSGQNYKGRSIRLLGLTNLPLPLPPSP